MTGGQRIRVVGAIIRRGDTVFAARRNPERSAGGLWEFPGGKVEVGETPEGALVRELHEELGIQVAVGPFIDRSLSTVGTATIELSCFSVALRDVEPTSSTDHDAMTWIPLDSLDQFEWAPGDVPIIEGLAAKLHDAALAENER